MWVRREIGMRLISSLITHGSILMPHSWSSSCDKIRFPHLRLRCLWGIFISSSLLSHSWKIGNVPFVNLQEFLFPIPKSLQNWLNVLSKISFAFLLQIWQKRSSSSRIHNGEILCLFVQCIDNEGLECFAIKNSSSNSFFQFIIFWNDDVLAMGSNACLILGYKSHSSAIQQLRRHGSQY